MNLKTKLGASVLLAASASMAQASTYDVSAVFSDGGMQSETVFNGSFNWDGTNVTNFTGLLSESMWGWNGTRSWTGPGGTSGTGVFDSNGTSAGGMSAINATADYQGYVNGLGTYNTDDAPMLNLTHQLATSTSGNLVTVSTFLQNNTDVVAGGGYDVANGDNAMTFGNNNAFFTLVLDKTQITNTANTADSIVYGDFTPLGMMGPMLTGPVGMTGYSMSALGSAGGGGSMGGAPLSLSITPVAAVPLPAAVWLFGGALMGLLGVSRRKSVLPA